MDRGASSGFITELLKSTSSPCFLLEMYFDDVTVRLTDAWRSVSWGGNLFTAYGHFLDFSGITETADLQIPSGTVTVSGIDQAWVSVALTKPFLDRRIVIYKGFLDYTQSVISSPIIVFDGRMDNMAISDSADGKCGVAITASSQWVDFDRRPGRHTNNQEQQVFFPSDLFFENCGQLNKQIRWGSA
jgi:hypothetical protein